MKVLVVGSGGREHSMIMKLAKSEQVDQLYAAPGNGGIEEHATCVYIQDTDIDSLIRFVKETEIDLTIVGPEKPLLLGITDRFNAEGLAIFAPTEDGAMLEGSKSFAKDFMKKYRIPTAAYETFTNAEEAKAYIEAKGAPIVVKADGLAAGKGVIVAKTKQEAIQAIDDMLVEKVFADAGSTIVVEECLVGDEFSLMAFVHENNVYPMVPARDHKRAFDDDKGPNTGGMGAYAPVSDITEETITYCTEEILQKAVDGLVQEGRSFTGILYAGLMMTSDGPKVIEFNARFGDPETQVVLPLLKNDLVQVITDVMNGQNPQLEWENQMCAGVVLASTGYPGSYEKGVPLPNIPLAENSFMVHAGTKQKDGQLISSGGRVLLVGAKDDSLEGATNLVYRSLSSMDGTGAFFYRKDIGTTIETSKL
ncbi:phosphoribosylamine--glycine ligase [Oceanobacillus halotolerans]|uniref:phosphoribosylamine--glycine ligase n=1 Tax=Oceanobacillus halotolerans TaxID=2663380 RepID=UPI0013DC6988|nr:phosphoribosylamine--glycine ligase [Oceanobacillus halotolerans]